MSTVGPPEAWGGLRRPAAALLSLLAALGLLALALRGAHLGRVLALVSSTPWLLLALVPYLVAQLFDSRALGLLLGPRQPGPRRVLRTRLAADAVAFSLPWGAAFGDATAVRLLSARDGVPAGEAAAAAATRHVFLGIAHGLMLLSGAWLGARALRTASMAWIGGRGLEWLVIGLGLGMSLGLATVLPLTGERQLARRLGAWIGRLRWRPLRRWLARHAGALRAFDGRMAILARTSTLERLRVIGLVWLSMLLDAAETFLILSLLGAGIGFASILSMESLLQLARVAAVALPAGLGVQDAGYIAFLQALGTPEAASVGAAFVLVKRAKELCWIGVGFALLAFTGRPASSAVAEASA